MFTESGSKLFFATHVRQHQPLYATKLRGHTAHRDGRAQVGYYTMKDGMETFPDPLPDGRSYPGGQVVSYDRETGLFDTYGQVVTSNGPEGAVSFAMDPDRNRAYVISWPHGNFLVFDLAAKSVQDLGPVAAGGEAVHPRTGQYRCLCRSLLIDPGDGSVYFTTSSGSILVYRHGDGVATFAEGALRRDYFGLYDGTKVRHVGRRERAGRSTLKQACAIFACCSLLRLQHHRYGVSLLQKGSVVISNPPPIMPCIPPEAFDTSSRLTLRLSVLHSVPSGRNIVGGHATTKPGSMAYHWRQVVWCASKGCAYGVHGNSGYLFQFDPRAEPGQRVVVLPRLTSVPSRCTGNYDMFSYGYLGFTISASGVVYYLTGGSVGAQANDTAKGEAKGYEDLHLVTYDLTLGLYKDHGAIYLPPSPGAVAAGSNQRKSPTYVNSIGVGHDGSVYSLGRVEGQRSALFYVSGDQIKLPDATARMR